MNFTTGLIIGLLVGWLVEWIIDWLFWRRRQKQLAGRLAAAEDEIAELNVQLAELTGATCPAVVRDRYCLEAINGIGPVFAQRLDEAGVRSFADLVAQAPARLREIVEAKYWQAVDPESWIAEARQYAQSPGGV